MIKVILTIFAVITLLTGIGGQAQTVEESMQNAAMVYSDWMAVIADITRDVEVQERDVQKFIDHWRDLEQLDLTDMDDEDAAEFKRNFDAALSDSRYVSWATARDLDPEEFLRCSLRITGLIMLEQVAAQEVALGKQRARQDAMIEEQCAQTDPKTCDQMKATAEASKAMEKSMAEARKQLRPPSAAERALFDRYGAQLEAAMAMDDEDSDSFAGEEDYYEDEEDYYYEDDEEDPYEE